MLASDCLLTLESVVTSAHMFLDKLDRSGKSISVSIHKVLPTLCSRLGNSARKFLRHNWDTENLENGWKNKVRPYMLCFQLSSYLFLWLLSLALNAVSTLA